MRFLAASLVAMAAVADAAKFQLDIAGDNNFAVYVSRAASPNTVTQLVSHSAPQQIIQEGWETPSRYTGIELGESDTLSVYIHNLVGPGQPGNVANNPSAITARLRETTSDAVDAFKLGGIDIPTSAQWSCIYRHETQGSAGVTFDPARLTGDAEDWAHQSLNPVLESTNYPLLADQNGPEFWTSAWEISKLGGANIWHNAGDAPIMSALGVTAANVNEMSTPWWIYGNDQQQSTSPVLAHHGWCRLKMPAVGGSNINGDPIFSGFQGQVFQFHGLPDEHFNLISSPSVQLNAHFVYLASGKCDAKATTACFSHPGTYMDALGFTIGDTRVKLAAGAYDAGLRVWVDDVELPRGKHNSSLSDYTQASLRYHHNGKVEIHTELIQFEVANSDHFMNIHASLSSAQLLQVGRKKHTVTDKDVCHTNDETSNHQHVESVVAKKYEITTALHGLIGQTWRNVKVCGRDWMGTVQDYIVPSLFGTEYHYNYYKY